MSEHGANDGSPSNGIGGGALRDSADLRDMFYRPALLSLPPRHVPRYLVPGYGEPLVGVRDQGTSDRCTGHALAALIDIQRLPAKELSPGSEPPSAPASAAPRERRPPVSARMLFEMGELVSTELGSGGEKRYSIRSVIKGFYHNGVCPQAMWPENRARDTPGLDMIKCTKEARHVSLGAYYRLAHRLADYHSALCEVGAILVSAQLHEGWLPANVAARGAIRPTESFADYGAHAFVIVGYDETGFFVLNSWGVSWKGVVDDQEVPGVAHWPYKDWATSVMDAWALRLAVPTPEAFEYTIGSQGSAFHGGAALGAPSTPPRSTDPISVPRQHVVGHYVHTDDERYVPTGSYPDSAENLERTLRYVRERMLAAVGASGGANAKAGGEAGEEADGTDEECLDGEPSVPIERVYLRIAGDTGTVEDAMHRVAYLRRLLRPKGVYPITLLWTARMASTFAVGIKACMREAVERMPDPSPDRDRLIESLIRPLGRPLWDQLLREATAIGSGDAFGDARRENGRKPGPLVLALERLTATLDARARRGSAAADAVDATLPRRRIELICEGAGVHPFLALLRGHGADALRLLSHVNRVHLAFPVCTQHVLVDTLRGFVAACDGTGEGAACRALMRRLVILRPDEVFLTRSAIGPYTASWFELVNNSFEREPEHESVREPVREPESGRTPDSKSPAPDLSAAALVRDTRAEKRTAKGRKRIAEDEKRLGAFVDLGIPPESHLWVGPKETDVVERSAILRSLVVDEGFVRTVLDPAAGRDAGGSIASDRRQVA